MNRNQSLHPQTSPILADIIRVDTCDMRKSMNFHPGICPACVPVPVYYYRYASPNGDGTIRGTTFPNNDLMNDLKCQYKEGAINRRKLLNKIKELDYFQDEYGRDAKKQYYEYGKQIRNQQIQREKQSGNGF